MRISRLEVELFRVPLKRPVSLPSSQDPRAARDVDLILTRLHTEHGPTGLGFTYALGGGGEAIKALIESSIRPIVIGEHPAKSEWLFHRAVTELDAIGFAGVAARAYAAVDFALWDWKGKLAGMPIYQLLGGYRTKLKAIAADVATPALGAKQAIKECQTALKAGAGGVQIEVGTEDPEVDVERVRQIREALPDWAWLEISAAGRYDLSTALWMGRIFEEEFAIDSYCDPLKCDDDPGMKRLTEHLEVAVSVGAFYDRPDQFLKTLRDHRVSALRLDLLRVGGLTPARKLMAAAELHHVAICPVRLPEIGIHLACSSVWGRMVESVDWFSELFTTGPTYHNDQLMPSELPGLGLTINESLLANYRL